MRNTPPRALLIAMLLLIAPSLAAQDVIRRREVVEFDSPEGWAMKYFGAATLLTSLGFPHESRPGSIDAGLETIQLPHLSTEERMVGFTGTKSEDLNKLPVFVRPRVTIGLPADLSLTLSYVPPVSVEGVEANLFSVALGRPIYRGSVWSAGVRVYGQGGTVTSDFTCPEKEARAPIGSEQNLYGCEERSSDEATLRYGGIELTASRPIATLRASTLHLGVSGNYLDNEFQVNARTFGFLDRTHLSTHGIVYTVQGGLSWPIRGGTAFGVELFYAPLEVVRLGSTSTTNDGLLNARLLLTHRLR